MFSKKNIVLLTVVWFNLGVSADDKTQFILTKSEYKKSLSKNCTNTYTAICLKLDLVSWVDKLNEEDNYSVMPGVSVVRENNSAIANTADMVTELARDFPNDPDARLDAFLMKKVTSYLNSHSVRLNLSNKHAIDTAQGRGGGGGMGGMILAAGAMMKGTLMALALGGIATLAGKALMTGLISLLLSAIIGLKSLAHHGHKSTTYEIVSKPIFSHANTHSVSHEEHGHGGGYSHSSYGRSFDIPLPLGFQTAYEPAI
ncbi:hypothetical protein NQ314_015106 [Rhamnusium bicolor]|uniref:Osiris 16 n=1 Tax=Rhamnusium bicolor TaxID=1586634 RepID=A0AAV8WZP0_9CUCU|nr:hypothetical protein NQ314_015106 [Rhamnusium bicolor]